MGAAFGGGDGVGEGVHGFGIRGGPLHGDFRGDADLQVLGLEVDDVRFDRGGLAGLHQVVDVVLDAVVVLVGDGLELVFGFGFLAGNLVAGLVGLAQVGQGDLQALVQERHLLETRTQSLKVVVSKILPSAQKVTEVPVDSPSSIGLPLSRRAVGFWSM